jgi:hypothetical protein
MLDKKFFNEFRESLRGGLILPGDPGYNDTRKVYNGMIDKKPTMITKYFYVTDVITSLNSGDEKYIQV